MSHTTLQSTGYLRSLIALAGAALLLVSIGCSSSQKTPVMEMAAETPAKSTMPADVQIKIGDGPSDLTATSNHSFSLDSLEDGQTAFSINGDTDEIYWVRLSPEDVTSLLSGSTVMTQAAAEKGSATKAVSIWVKQTDDESEKSSGW